MRVGWTVFLLACCGWMAAEAAELKAGDPFPPYALEDAFGRTNALNPQTRAVPVFYEVTNQSGRFREGMFAEITIDTSGRQTVLAVPKQAVITEQGKTFVFVFKGGESFEKRAIVLGAEGQEFHEIKSGLEAGERIVIEGIYQLRSTQPGS